MDNRDAGAGGDYRYPLLEAYGFVSRSLAFLVLVGGIVLTLVAVRLAETGSAAVIWVVALVPVTLLLAIGIGVAADVVRWMHDVVNLLDEQSEYLHTRD